MLQVQVDSLVAAIQAAGQEKPDSLSDLLRWEVLLAAGLKVASAVLVAVLAYSALKLVLRRIEKSLGDPGSTGALTLQEQRTRTLVSLFRSIGRVLIALI